MELTSAQLVVLKNFIIATPAISSEPVTDGGAENIAKYMNVVENPSFTVWRTRVELEEIVSTIDPTELVGLTTLKMTAYQCLLLAGFVNPSKAKSRQSFDEVFSAAGGQATRPLLLALWKRLATRVEKLYATGTGSDASPATLVFEGLLTVNDVIKARNS